MLPSLPCLPLLTKIPSSTLYDSRSTLELCFLSIFFLACCVSSLIEYTSRRIRTWSILFSAMYPVTGAMPSKSQQPMSIFG